MSDGLIQASTGKASTMSDGTLRIVFEFEPRHAQAAFALFGMSGSPCVIARLTQEAATAAQQAETVAGNADVPAADENPKGGDLARLAGRWCNDPHFLEWVGVATEQEAAAFIYAECGIESRKELDHNRRAADIFHANIREPHRAWRKARGLA